MHLTNFSKSPHFICICFLLLRLGSKTEIMAQNLVPNPGFESYMHFPDSYGDWNFCHGWYNCSGDGSPDYLHTSGTSVANLPDCGLAQIYPYDGNAAMGFSTYRSDFEHREYISTELTSPLITGETYIVSFWLTNGESDWYSGTGTNHIGIYFSNAMPDQGATNTINVTPQVDITDIIWLTDWQYFEFSYTATEDFSQITIGNFFEDVNTETNIFYELADNPTRSEYIIDNIYVGLVPEPETIVIDTALCLGTSYFLPDGSEIFSSTIDTSILSGADGADSIIISNVTFISSVVVEQTVQICEATSYVLPDGNYAYSEGIYTSVISTAGGCDSTIVTTIIISTAPEITVLAPVYICTDAEAISLEAFPSGGIFEGPGIIENNFNPQLAEGEGTYTLSYTLIMNECSFIQEFTITVIENLAMAGTDQTINFGERFILHGTTAGEIKWSPDTDLSCNTCDSPSGLINQTTTFLLESINEYGCYAADEVTITVLHEGPDSVFVPNTFTPNGDGINDYFIPLGLAINKIVHFQVYNRWGELIYSEENITPESANQGWDGKFNGTEVQEGVYIYTAEIEYLSGIITQLKGNITLIK